MNGVPIKGKLDKLEFIGKEVNVVDYKTGDPEKAKQKFFRHVIESQMAVITGARLYFIKYWLITMNINNGM